MSDRNIVLVTTDDHAQWCLGAYGHSEVDTPTLDWMAGHGVQLDNAFCPTPVCSPARASLMTGLRPSQHGIHDWIDLERDSEGTPWLHGITTLPEWLGAAGYHTAHTGKWHCGQQRLAESFDTVRNMHRGGFDGPKFSQARDRWITDGAIEMLQERDGDAPFFLSVGYSATHMPWRDGPERLVSRYRGSSFPDIPDDPTYRFGRGDVIRPEDPEETLAQYYAAVTGIDEQIGRLIDALAAAGTLEQTVFVYTADHGHNCGHHGIWGKGNGTIPQNMLDESIRVPQIFGPWGGVAPDQTRDEFVDHCDLFRTLLDAAGVTPDAQTAVPGSSYWPQVSAVDGDHAWEQRQYCEYGDVRMVRTPRYKLIRRYFDAPDLFFDLDRDPRETHNRHGTHEYQAAVERLRRQLSAEFAAYDDLPTDGVGVSELPEYNHGSEPWQQHRPSY